MEIMIPNDSDIAGLRLLWSRAFGDSDEFLDAFFGAAFGKARSRCAKEDGTIVAALYWFDCECGGEPLAYIYAVATLPEYRGRGICHSLMERTHAELSSLGYAGAVLVPGEPDLIDFYESMGYTVCGFVSEIEAFAAGEPLTVREINGAEYGDMRRELLPDRGVVQEGKNLEFLATYAKLYAGDGFIVAATDRGGKLYAAEYLGDRSNISRILKTLGYKNGVFRTVGSEKPFAMYLSLEGGVTPAYFGIAFD